MMLVRDPTDWIEEAQGRSDRLFLRTLEGRDFSYAALLELSGPIAAECSSAAAYRAATGLRFKSRIRRGRFFFTLLVCASVQCSCPSSGETPNEVEYYLRDSQPRVAIVRPQDRALLEPLARQAQVGCVETLGADGTGSLLPLAGESAVDFHAPRRHESGAIAAIIYTSGTTGHPKGAMLTRANLASNAAVLAEAWRFCEADVLLHTLPLFHIHGLFVAINTGACVEIQPAARLEVRCGSGGRAFHPGFSLHGGADALHAPAAAKESESKYHGDDAPVCSRARRPCWRRPTGNFCSARDM